MIRRLLVTRTHHRGHLKKHHGPIPIGRIDLHLTVQHVEVGLAEAIEGTLDVAGCVQPAAQHAAHAHGEHGGSRQRFAAVGVALGLNGLQLADATVLR